jgi:hypothetical protein
MRKHRLYGVAIAVLLATTPFHQWPRFSGRSSPTHHRTIALQLTSATLPTSAKSPAGPASVAADPDATLFAPPASPAPRAVEALWARANFLAGRVAPTLPPPASPAPVPAQPVGDHPPTPPAPPAPRPVTAAAGSAHPVVADAPVASGAGAVGVWAALRLCESGGNYADNTGNGYYGAYQFSLSTWRGLGLPGLPSQASPAAQDQAAQRLQARSGWGQWPSCARRLGL